MKNLVRLFSIPRGLVILALVVTGPAFAQGDVKIDLVQFGVSSFYRPGDFVGIELLITSNLDEAVTAHVVWEVPEGLGDIAEHTRVVALTPGLPTSTWLYAKLLPTVDNSTNWAVRVYLDDDGNRGRELWATRISPLTLRSGAPTFVPRTSGLIGLVGGPNLAGLDQYNISLTGPGLPTTGHEYTHLANGIAPVQLPDRWEGLDAFEALVWTDAQPGSLRDSQSRAIRNWVHQGGHFVIILQQAGNDWGLGSLPVNALHDLLPETLPVVEDSTTTELLPVLSKRDRLPLRAQVSFSIRVFRELDNGYEPLLVMPEGDERVLGVRRLYGHGMITVLGVDISSGQLTGMSPAGDRGGGVLEADKVWKLILGRRQDVLFRPQLVTLQQADTLVPANRRTKIDFGKGKLIQDRISLSSRAFAGIGLAFVLFVAYWLLAGPIGFGLLRGAKKVKHAWVAFALTSAAFTFIAWGGVKIFSQRHTEVQHVTFLDYVATNPDLDPGGASDQSTHRAVSWFTVFLPGYGERALSLADDGETRSVLAPFAAPGEDLNKFKNVDRYEVRIDEPATYQVPVRATTKEMYARWEGHLAADWGGSFEVTEPISMNAQGVLSGKIGHSFPTDLTNVTIFLVEPSPTQPISYVDDRGIDPNMGALTATPPMRTSAMSLTRGSQIRRDTEFDLSVLRRNPFIRHFDTQYDTARGEDVNMGSTSISQRSHDRSLQMLSFFNMMTQPGYVRPNRQSSDRPGRAQRSLGRELDLSEWLTRPCLIIYGHLDGSELPIPFTVDGSAPKSSGLTVVRWIYPLPYAASQVAERAEE